jgi:DNA polymerase-3 subunit delta'
VSGLFDDVIGHERVVELLESELASPSQAYLFVGPSSIGKSMMAVRFAAGLLDPPEGSEEARDRSMRLALAQSHPDLVVVEPQGVASIGVDQAREVVRKASMAPVEGARTVFLIPEAGTLTEQAANALLKTLEEPGATVVFLLVAESEDQFPATIASRCRVVRMGRVPDEVLTEALVARGLEPARAGGLAVVSAGRPGLALALMTRPEVASFREFWLSIPAKVTARPGDAQRLAGLVLEEIAPLVDDSVPGGLDKDATQRHKRRIEMSLLVTGLEILASWYADAASLQVGGPIRNTDVDLNHFTDVSPRKAVHGAELALAAVVDIQANLRRELVLTNLFAELGAD